MVDRWGPTDRDDGVGTLCVANQLAAVDNELLFYKQENKSSPLSIIFFKRVGTMVSSRAKVKNKFIL
jgi:hypothetical protein